MANTCVPGRHAADEEARAEVDVLNSQLEKTSQLTRKIQACLGRLDSAGKSVREVTKPLNGETARLQTLGRSASLLCLPPIAPDTMLTRQRLLCRHRLRPGLDRATAPTRRQQRWRRARHSQGSRADWPPCLSGIRQTAYEITHRHEGI